MKSYFAKLAARATLANVPASSPATSANLHDPFEETSTVIEPSSPSAIAKETRPSDRRNETSLVHAQPMKETITSRTETVKSDDSLEVKPQSESFTPSDNTVAVNTSHSRVPAKPSLIVDPDPALGTSDSSLTAVKTEHILQPVNISRDTRSSVPHANLETKDTTELNVASQSAEDEGEQSLLLRKADAFMAAILERKDERDSHNADEQIQQAPRRRETLTELAPARLQPAPVATRPIDSVDESPSLVIGKLTVEVLPPAPPPITPSRQVIVVRGDRGARGHSIRSSQRFGLGQF
ncbi:MAG TPA: hypothetical protein VF251_09015 [Pyrinomonadaceae bacterium]